MSDNQKTRIAVLGWNGHLGLSLTPKLKSSNFHVTTIGRHVNSNLVVTDLVSEDFSNVFKLINPEIVINLAAMTDVQLCEENPDKAEYINSKLVDLLANGIERTNKAIHLIQISTDHIYNSFGYSSENSKEELLNNYAKTKFLGERAALNGGGAVYRVNFVGLSRPKEPNFSEWLYSKFSNHENIYGFSDVYFSPLFIDDLSDAILVSLKLKKPGLFNIGATNGISKLDFINRLAMKFDQNLLPNISARAYSDMAFDVMRPKDMRMDCNKFAKEFGAKLPSIDQTISKLAKQFSDRRSESWVSQ